MALAMTLAMMSPMAVPLCRAVARATLWWQAPRTVLAALTAYLAGWGVRGAGRCVTSCLVPMALTAAHPTPQALAGVGALLLVERFV